MGRKEVEEFLKNKSEFSGKEFVEYMVSLGYKANTAWTWLTRLQKEKRIEKISDGRYRVSK